MELVVYHVTSSIFIKSIKDNGLIGVDLRRKLPTLSVAMSEIINILDCKYSDSKYDWGESSGFRDNCKRMADTEYKNGSGQDYEYGNAYVTSSVSRLAIYNSYEFGSELLTYFYRLYRCLYQKYCDESKIIFDAKYPELVRIISVEYKRNLILKAEVDTSDLMHDTGGHLNEKDIDYIQLMKKECNGDVQRSYRMARTLNPNEIEIMTMDGKMLNSLGKLLEYVIPDKWPQVQI